MSEYIERDMVMKLVKLGYLVGNHNYSKVCKLIEDIPSADVVDIVRCRECKYNVNEPEAGNANCIILYGMTDQDGFCHYGERMGK